MLYQNQSTMPDLHASGSAFMQILQKLEEEHCRVIAELRKEHARELSHLGAESQQHQLTPLALQAAPEEAPNGKGASQGSNPQSTEIPTSAPKTLVREDSTLHTHVLQHLQDQHDSHAVTNWLDKYVMARGWHSIPAKPKARSMVHKLVVHHGFDGVCAFFIFLNTALLGAISSYRARKLELDTKLPLPFLVANYTFSCWFLVELTLRWIAEGFFAFLSTSPHVQWNLVDLFVVSTDIIELLVMFMTGGKNSTIANLNVMRLLRVLRVARALRVVRMLRFCRELRVMVISMFKSSRSLMWAVVLLSIIFYIFAVFLMQAVTDHLALQLSKMQRPARAPYFPKESNEGFLEKYFGSLMMTYYVLFMTISGGISWGEVSDALLKVHWINGIVLCFFVFFTTFAMLNIITGFFVETANASVKEDDDEVIQEELKSEDSLMRQLHHIFQGVDLENKGRITEAQFSALVNSEDQRAFALLQGLGLKVGEAHGLFALLDLENTGSVKLDDFIIGCMRLRGGAQEVDLVSLIYEVSKLQASSDRLAEFVQDEFKRLDKFEDRVDIGLLLKQQADIALLLKQQADIALLLKHQANVALLPSRESTSLQL